VAPKGGALWLLNAHIAEYAQAGAHLQHAPRRARKLLLKQREINRLSGAVARAGSTTSARAQRPGRSKARLLREKG
jgi:SsrA-binding protein